MSMLMDMQTDSLELWQSYRRAPVSTHSSFESNSSETLVVPKKRVTRLSAATDFPWTSLCKSQGDGGFDDATVGSSTLPRTKKSGGNGKVHKRPSLRSFDTGSSISGPYKSRDRFLPVRRSSLEPAIQSFRINKNPLVLSMEEKLHRNPLVSSDSFGPQRRVVTAPSTTNSPLANAGRSGGGGASLLSFQRDTSGPESERQVDMQTPCH